MNLKGLNQSDIILISNCYMNKRLRDDDFLISNVAARLKMHQLDGYEPVFVSGSSEDFIYPIAKFLGVKYILATRMLVDCNGYYTGEIVSSMIGDGKRDAVKIFIENNDAISDNCLGYGDHISDLPFLKILGFPHVVAYEHQELFHIAKENGWPIIYPVFDNRKNINIKDM